MRSRYGKRSRARSRVPAAVFVSLAVPLLVFGMGGDGPAPGEGKAPEERPAARPDPQAPDERGPPGPRQGPGDGVLRDRPQDGGLPSGIYPAHDIIKRLEAIMGIRIERPDGEMDLLPVHIEQDIPADAVTATNLESILRAHRIYLTILEDEQRGPRAAVSRTPESPEPRRQELHTEIVALDRFSGPRIFHKIREILEKGDPGGAGAGEEKEAGASRVLLARSKDTVVLYSHATAKLIIRSANRTEMEAVKTVILDLKPPRQTRRYHTYRCSHSRAEVVAQKVLELMDPDLARRVRIAAYPPSNTILIRSSQDDLERILGMIREKDTPIRKP